MAKRKKEIEAVKRIGERTRNISLPVAHLGAILLFCVTELANIDPMYQNSLQSYMSIFQEALMNSAKSSEVEERTEAINTTFKRSLYQRICRSLFARDQLLFSFTMSLKIYDVDPTLLRWVLMGGFEEEDHHAVPNPFTWLPELIWKLLRRAATQLDGFAHLTELLQHYEMFFMDFHESSNPLELELSGVLNDGVLQRLALNSPHTAPASM
ncbi:putative dynein heavy chain [Leptomonas pyrrhocoris]|uniref:Putative dynein heavy chain n=1 Tax=Leptomonas pyrrhocoris TaxID=157538 RepID=A0A0N0DTN7_LEPPY|nr:putative dynein heavy chain [Leptomonas pyrrhocoris]KPA77741.1 putative dynein heavy chain [Leptomonas pyrrhocoris]|eukprot:XP_015656180.1 putative dynein heavy chain [Leptomonas pyrrhocoris]